jgi:hypothetical protein
MGEWSPGQVLLMMLTISKKRVLLAKCTREVSRDQQLVWYQPQAKQEFQKSRAD